MSTIPVLVKNDHKNNYPTLAVYQDLTHNLEPYNGQNTGLFGFDIGIFCYDFYWDILKVSIFTLSILEVSVFTLNILKVSVITLNFWTEDRNHKTV